MATRIFRHTMSTGEQNLWNAEEMDGWRKAFEACVEHDARDEGYKKFELIDRKGLKVAAGPVRVIEVPEPSGFSNS